MTISWYSIGITTNSINCFNGYFSVNVVKKGTNRINGFYTIAGKNILYNTQPWPAGYSPTNTYPNNNFTPGGTAITTIPYLNSLIYGNVNMASQQQPPVMFWIINYTNSTYNLVYYQNNSYTTYPTTTTIATSIIQGPPDFVDRISYYTFQASINNLGYYGSFSLNNNTNIINGFYDIYGNNVLNQGVTHFNGYRNGQTSNCTTDNFFLNSNFSQAGLSITNSLGLNLNGLVPTKLFFSNNLNEGTSVYPDVIFNYINPNNNSTNNRVGVTNSITNSNGIYNTVWYSISLTKSGFTFFNGWMNVNKTTNVIIGFYTNGGKNIIVNDPVNGDNKFTSNSFSSNGTTISIMPYLNTQPVNLGATEWRLKFSSSTLIIDYSYNNASSWTTLAGTYAYTTNQQSNPPQTPTFISDISWCSFQIFDPSGYSVFNNYFSTNVNTNIVQGFFNNIRSNILVNNFNGSDNFYISGCLLSNGISISSIPYFNNIGTVLKSGPYTIYRLYNINSSGGILSIDGNSGSSPYSIPVSGYRYSITPSNVSLSYGPPVSSLAFSWYIITLNDSLTDGKPYFYGYFSVDNNTGIISEFYDASKPDSNILLTSYTSYSTPSDNVFVNNNFVSLGTVVSGIKYLYTTRPQTKKYQPYGTDASNNVTTFRSSQYQNLGYPILSYGIVHYPTVSIICSDKYGTTNYNLNATTNISQIPNPLSSTTTGISWYKITLTDTLNNKSFIGYIAVNNNKQPRYKQNLIVAFFNNDGTNLLLSNGDYNADNIYNSTTVFSATGTSTIGFASWLTADEWILYSNNNKTSVNLLYYLKSTSTWYEYSGNPVSITTIQSIPSPAISAT